MKVSQNDQIQMQTWLTSGFLMNGRELRSFSNFQILTWIAYSDLSRNLENWLILMFAFIPVKLWKSVKMIKFKYKHDLQVFSWWLDKNSKVFIIFKFWPKSHTRTLAENLKIDYFWSFSSFTVKLWKSVKMIKFECKLDLQVVSSSKVPN